MPGKSSPNAVDFLSKFLQAYHETRGEYTTARWEQEGWPEWTDVILYEDQGVMARTARKFGLEYWDGEPLKLDGVFHEKAGSWFPIRVAIENENDHTTFDQEVAKLLSIRCPLKVGVTFVNTSSTAKAKKLERIERTIKDKFREIGAVVREDPDAEYLFVVGVAFNREKEISQWYSLNFRADDGPQKRTFQLVEGGEPKHQLKAKS